MDKLILVLTAAMAIVAASLGATAAANSKERQAKPSEWEPRGSIMAGYDVFEHVKTGECVVIVKKSGCATTINNKVCIVGRNAGK